MSEAAAPQPEHNRTDRLAGRLSFWGLVEAACALTCFCTVAGFFGGAWWVVELTCHFRMQYFWILLVAALAFLLRRRRRAAVAIAVFAFVNLCELLPAYVPRARPSATGRTWRASLSNVNTDNRGHGQLMQLIRDQEPDLIVLEEINEAWVGQLRGLGADYPFSRWHPREDNFGIALLSRSPLDSVEIRHIGQAGVPSVVARLTLNGRPVTLIGTHPLPPSGPVYASLRDEQLRALGAFIRPAREEVIVMGDLNATSWSPVFRRLVRTARLRDSRDGFGIQPTWPCGLPVMHIPIDHCLVSEGIIVHNRWTGPDVGSDHFPVFVDFSLRE